MMVEKLFVADLQKISGSIERKICAVGVTKILTEGSWSPAIELCLLYFFNISHIVLHWNSNVYVVFYFLTIIFFLSYHILE